LTIPFLNICTQCTCKLDIINTPLLLLLPPLLLLLLLLLLLQVCHEFYQGA
jgi:hypothetical protein